MMFIYFILIPYLVGSVPFGLVLSKLAGHGDIRKIGSGNIGATNVLRTGNKLLAAATLLLDGLKGFIAVNLASHMAHTPDMIFLASIAALTGHIFPVWLGFKGGKGVATAIGVLFYLSPLLAAITIITWIATFIISRFSSLSALIAFLVTTIISIMYFNTLAELVALVTLIIFATHRQNISRLIKGHEYKWSKK